MHCVTDGQTTLCQEQIIHTTFSTISLNNMYTGQSREASSDIAVALTFLRRTYPRQLANYSSDDLPDALDLITAGSTTQRPADGRQLNRRRRGRRPMKEFDLEAFCRQQTIATQNTDVSSPEPRHSQNTGVSSPSFRHGGLAEFWRKRRKAGRQRRRQLRARASAGAMAGRSHGMETGDGDTRTALERRVVRSSTLNVVTGEPITADGAPKITPVSLFTTSPADSAAAERRGENVTVVYNATGVDLYFRTAHVLHYASIVILGLFVLQVTRH